MAAWSEALLVPLVTRLGEQEAVIRDQAEMLGRQGAELVEAKVRLVEAGAARDAAEIARRRNQRRLRTVVAVLVILAIAGAVSAWAR